MTDRQVRWVVWMRLDGMTPAEAVAAGYPTADHLHRAIFAALRATARVVMCGQYRWRWLQLRRRINGARRG